MSGAAGVQMRAVQMDMELGPAGRPGGAPVGERSGGAGVGQRINSGLGTAAKLGGAALPHIKTAFETIQAIKGIWDLLKPGGGKGETKQLPEAISGFNFNESVNHPIGAHHLAFEFIWDDANTVLDVDVTFFPPAWLTHVAQATFEGEPET